MPFKRKYIAPLVLLGIMQKPVNCALVAPVALETGIVAVDGLAKVTGYEDKYRNNAGRIINSLESELRIKIRQPQIEVGFHACRQLMLNESQRLYSDFGLELGMKDFLYNYLEYTKESLLMNSYISEEIFGNDGTVPAIYANNTICFPPFDMEDKYLTPDWNLGHEIMHGYVEQANPDFMDIDSFETIAVRRLITEGIATYASDLAVGSGRIIFNASLRNISSYTLDDLWGNELLFYLLGTNFVSCAVDEIGLEAITLLAMHPPSEYEEIKDCKGYIHSIESLNEE